MTAIDPKSFFPAEQFGDVLETTALTLGLSGAAVHSVKTTKGEFVLRIHGEDKEAWKRSIMLQALAADQGVAPPLLLVDKKHAATISLKISGISFGAAVSNPETRAAAMSSLMAKVIALHQIPNVTLAAKDPMELGREVWREQSQRPGCPDWVQPLGKRLDEIEKTIAHDKRRVFSHGDLNPANIIWDGTRVWLVDWEVAGLAHPYIDVATIAMFLDLPEEAALGLLAAQEGKVLDAQELAVFSAIRQLVRIVFGTIFLRLVPDLRNVTFAAKSEMLSLSQCFGLLAQGKLKMHEPQGQALIGSAILKPLI